MGQDGHREYWTPVTQQAAGTEVDLPRSMTLLREGADLLQQLLEELRAEWGRFVNTADSLIARVEQEVQSNVWLRLVEWWTAELATRLEVIRRTIDEAGKGIETLLQLLSETVQRVSEVTSLFEKAMVYTTTLNSELSDISEKMNGALNLIYWRGPTKDSYDQKVQEQIKAVVNTHEKVQHTGTWLASVGSENLAIVAELGDRVGAVLGAVATGTADAAFTGAGAYTQAVFVLHMLSEAIGQTVTQAISYVAKLPQHLARISTQVTNLRSTSENNTGLPDGRWPQVAVVQ